MSAYENSLWPESKCISSSVEQRKAIREWNSIRVVDGEVEKHGEIGGKEMNIIMKIEGSEEKLEGKHSIKFK